MTGRRYLALPGLRMLVMACLAGLAFLMGGAFVAAETLGENLISNGCFKCVECGLFCNRP